MQWITSSVQEKIEYLASSSILGQITAHAETHLESTQHVESSALDKKVSIRKQKTLRELRMRIQHRPRMRQFYSPFQRLTWVIYLNRH